MTLIISPAEPRPIDPTRPTLPGLEKLPKSCGCEGDDRDLVRLRALMAVGVDQWTASRMVWSPDLLPNPATQPGRWARVLARTSLTAAFPWLRLPAEGVS